MPTALTPYISRISAALIALAVTWLAAKGINLDAETQSNLKDLIETAIFVVVYAVSHRTIDKKANPGDTASSHLAKVAKQEVRAMKVAEARWEQSTKLATAHALDVPQPFADFGTPDPLETTEAPSAIPDLSKLPASEKGR
jgi:hypothetical protein